MLNNLYKVTVLLSMAASLFVAYYTNWYWSNVCAVEGCGVGYINSFLAPILKASLAFAVLSLFFTLLPSHYFKAWLQYVAWWLLPGAFLIAYNTPAMGNIFWYDREDTVVMLGFIAGAITLLFVAFHWYQNRKNKTT